jgi:hypothetical protein
MKNLFLLPTDKPSRFYSTARTLTKKRGYAFGEHYIPNTRNMFSNHNIYITSDEEIKDVRPHKGKWQLEKGQILNQFPDYLTDLSECKLVIMTTDPQLIADGVQAIDDEFLEWFVKNPSCESVEVEKFHGVNTSIAEVNAVSGDGSLNWEGKSDLRDYKIIIPKEEPKQELERGITITQVEKKSAVDWLKPQIELMLMDGHKPYPNQLEEAFEIAKDLENQKQGYSEEDMKQFAFECVANFLSNNDNKVEMSLVEVITDRNNKKFEQFKKNK